jgi:hypothetical protein
MATSLANSVNSVDYTAPSYDVPKNGTAGPAVIFSDPDKIGADRWIFFGRIATRPARAGPI